jgi:hypothetical protein
LPPWDIKILNEPKGLISAIDGSSHLRMELEQFV